MSEGCQKSVKVMVICALVLSILSFIGMKFMYCKYAKQCSPFSGYAKGKCLKEKFNRDKFSLFEGEHLISLVVGAEQKGVMQKEIFRVNEKTGETFRLVSQIKEDQRIDAWIPVSELSTEPATEPVKEVKSESACAV